MFVFGLLIALVLCLVLLAGFINELMQDDWDEACARMIDKLDERIDGASTHIQRTANALKMRWKGKE